VDIKIEVLDRADAEVVDPETVEAFAGLIPMLSTNAPVPDAAWTARVIANPANTQFVARTSEGIAGSRISGLLTLVTLELPTGPEARIEDVVVDPVARGHGVGRALVEAALRHAADQGARHVDLTSNPSRVAARRLYQSLGFELRETGCFRHTLATVPKG
jgi:ribosomal protein S18 acetylase RimI-like enzyme